LGARVRVSPITRASPERPIQLELELLLRELLMGYPPAHATLEYQGFLRPALSTEEPSRCGARGV
jgi:hypothetical protein